MIEIGIICEVKDDRARVKLGEIVTDFLPVFQSFTNSHAVSFSPIRVLEQVLVLPVRGSLNSGVILRGLYQDAFKANANNKKSFISFEDGTNISYDAGSSVLSIESPKSIDITCQSANLTAQTTTITSPNVQIKGNTTIAGAINTSAMGGGAGSFEINGSLNISGSLNLGGDLNAGGSISDSRGSLTNHTNNGYGRD